MKMNPYELSELISKYIQEELSAEESLALDRWLSESEKNKELFDHLVNTQHVKIGLKYFDGVDIDLQWEKAKQSRGNGQFSRLVPYLKYAAITVGFLLGLFFLFPSTSVDLSKEDTLAIGKEIYPGGDKATLRFENGVVFDLNALKEGEIWQEGGVRIEKGANGELVYTTMTSQEPVKQAQVNMVSTPRGGQYRIALPDGSLVWLNAESSLTFPSVFANDTRVVKLSGEAYFEVTENISKPFKVITTREEVEVLGTHFNVSSYGEDAASFVTLIEGKVKVSSETNRPEILNPGQQSVIREGVMQVRSVNLEEAIAWKNGEFMFLNEGMENVIKKLERWYDIEIVLVPELENISIWGYSAQAMDRGRGCASYLCAERPHSSSRGSRRYRIKHHL